MLALCIAAQAFSAPTVHVAQPMVRSSPVQMMEMSSRRAVEGSVGRPTSKPSVVMRREGSMREEKMKRLLAMGRRSKVSFSEARRELIEEGEQYPARNEDRKARKVRSPQ